MASKMMMGMPVTALDDMSISAISELGNMIMGNAATILLNKGICYRYYTTKRMSRRYDYYTVIYTEYMCAYPFR